ncbi:polysaccharide deacetylase family protein [Streptomyces sp. T-3]|nr:polysaccharide deacetylase family protein [Streptomyces sp. T-3]
MPRTKSAVRSRTTAAAPAAAVALSLSLSLALALTGCSGVVSPKEARSEAGNADKGKFGPVDCRRAKCVALTFDGGPGEDTPRLLDTLKEEQVPATFFLLGKNHVKKYPDVVERIADEGHEVANHTWTHKILSDQPKDAIREEIELTQDAIEAITGKRPTLMRPPQGRTNGDVDAITKELGLSQVLWSVTAKDYTRPGSDVIEKRVLEQTRPDGIILLHDIYDGTVPAVPGIIDKLKAKGYAFVTVPQLMAPAVPEPGTVYRP